MLVGKLIYWAGNRNFGFVEVEIPERGGTRLDKYFLHRTRIGFTSAGEPQVGHFVRFDVGERLPGKPFPLAVDAQIFETQAQAAAREASEEVSQ